MHLRGFIESSKPYYISYLLCLQDNAVTLFTIRGQKLHLCLLWSVFFVTEAIWIYES